MTKLANRDVEKIVPKLRTNRASLVKGRGTACGGGIHKKIHIKDKSFALTKPSSVGEGFLYATKSPLIYKYMLIAAEVEYALTVFPSSAVIFIY